MININAIEWDDRFLYPLAEFLGTQPYDLERMAEDVNVDQYTKRYLIVKESYSTLGFHRTFELADEHTFYEKYIWVTREADRLFAPVVER